MSRLSALLLLAVVVLGTAMPALACFTPMTSHSCCESKMQDCASMPLMMGGECCTARSSQAPAEPETAIVSDHALTLVVPIATEIAEIPANPGLVYAAIELKAPPGPSSALSVLRI